jgi:mutator protein MutT
MEQNPHSSLHHSSTPSLQPIEVAAGLIFRDGKLLITRRHADAHLGGLWEFPGGKREAGETFEQCLVRELREELAVEARVGEVFDSVTHAYPGKTVHLKFFICELPAGEPQPHGCAALKWVNRSELEQYKFPEADAQLLERLQRDEELWTARD